MVTVLVRTGIIDPILIGRNIASMSGVDRQEGVGQCGDIQW
jgi:hypothetical protein